MQLRRNGIRHRVKHSEGSWAVSYVDMLTLLLCFFIIFYNVNIVEKQDKSELTAIEQIIFDLKSGGGQGAGSGTGVGTGTGTGTDGNTGVKKATGDAKANEKTTLSDDEFNFLQAIRQNIDEKSGNISTKYVAKALEVNFAGISFFNSASTKLNEDGRKVVEKLIVILSNHKEKVRVTVQGHTDPRAINKSKLSISDNWELSVLRATSVLKLFIEKGFNAELLSAEGFADTMNRKVAAKIDSEITETEMAGQRRVTFKIEPRLK